MIDQLAHLPEYLTAHLQLSLLALLISAAISVPAGIWVTRRPALEPGLLGAASVLQTIPSLALLALMVPALSALGVLTSVLFGFDIRSIGFLPALLALTLYGILPVLRNTVTGIRGVDVAYLEAARGVGMSPRQSLTQVELPLALPVIVAGIRTSAVWIVGTATLATPVGATSLGNYIFAGLQTRNFGAVVLGSVAAALLALLLDGLVRVLERGLRLHRRRDVFVGLGTLVALVLYALGSLAIELGGGTDRPIAIGSKTFTEQYVLAEILAQQIGAETGDATRSVESLGSTVAFDALRAGELDLYVDYSGTIWATIMQRKDRPDDRARVLEEVTAYLHDEHGIGVIAVLGFENTYALAMTEERANAIGVRRLSELIAQTPSLEIGGDFEFFERAEWAALVDHYGFAFRSQRSMDPSLMYEAVKRGEVDVISAFSTDGRIAAFDLRLLVDDGDVIPPYDAVVLASPQLRARHPEVVEAVAALGGRIDAASMQRMNRAVDQEGRSPASVAREFLSAPTR